MVHLLIINVKIPANAQVFFAGLLGFVTFDIIELGPYIRSWLGLVDEELVNDNFESLGYESNYFVINMGTLVLAMVYFTFMLFFYVVTMKCGEEDCCSSFLRCRRKTTKGLIWN